MTSSATSQNNDANWVPAMFSECSLSEAHLTRMKRAGIPEGMAREARLFSAGPDDITRYTGVRVSCWGIGFPYPGENGYVRFRLDEPDGDMKYVSRRGDGNRLYVPPGVRLDAPEVVITEGEKKALAAAARGINCVAVAGIDSWRQRGVLGEKLSPEEALLERLNRDWSGQTIILTYDSDITPQHKRYDAFPTLAEVLYARGAAQVKVITLPELESVEGKVGLDDYLLAYERASENGAEKFHRLAKRASIWVPTSFGAGTWSEKILAERDGQPPKIVLLALAAMRAAYGEVAASSRIKELFPGKFSAAWRDAKCTYTEVIQRQRPIKRQETGQDEENLENLRTFAEAFPPAAETPFADYPIPPGWDIKPDGKVVQTKKYDGDTEEKVVLSAPVALATMLVPAEKDEDDVHYEVQWRQEGLWKKMQIAAGDLFDHKRFNIMANQGVPVDSGNAALTVAWLAALRDLKEKAGLPKKIVVSRSGWHTVNDNIELFAVGRDIYTKNGKRDGAAGSTPDEPDPSDPLTEWKLMGDSGERQMLEAISAKGEYEKQKNTYLKYLTKYPLAAFFTGAGAAGPLMRCLVEEGESEINGFVVETTDPESGRGKTTLNMFPAGLWGNPSVGGMIRTANQTTMHSEILLSMHSDISAHIDETQLVRFGDAMAEIVYSLALGMGRGRGARNGGSRRTRRWRSVLIVSAERSVLDVVKARQGVFDRVLSLPPLYRSKDETSRREAENIQRELKANYGQLGRRYVEWLMEFSSEERKNLILDAYHKWKDILDEATDRATPVTDGADGSSEKNQTLKRLAKRAAACLAGLELLLRSMGQPEDMVKKTAAEAADVVWGHLIENTEGRAFLSTVLSVLQSFVSENKELIDGLRDDTDRKPPRWAGKRIEKNGVAYIALYRNAVTEALKKYGDIEYETAVRALRDKGFLLRQNEKRNGYQVRMNGTREFCLTVRADALLGGESESFAAQGLQGFDGENGAEEETIDF